MAKVMHGAKTSLKFFAEAALKVFPTPFHILCLKIIFLFINLAFAIYKTLPLKFLKLLILD